MREKPKKLDIFLILCGAYLLIPQEPVSPFWFLISELLQ